MKQYAEMKKKHPDAVLLFRVGDFYETFSDDAITASAILGITLTRRANGAAAYVELAGFPHHALNTYLPKLVRAGKRVAICEQLEDPKLTKKLVKRGITELVTPGVTLDDNVLDNRRNNFLAALHTQSPSGASGAVWGLGLLDISTGEFLAAQGQWPYIEKLMAGYNVSEVIVQRGMRTRVTEALNTRMPCFELDDWVFTADAATERLLGQFGTNSLKGFGISGMPVGEVAAGACLHYLDVTQHTQTGHITRLTPVEADTNVRLDRFTMRNLELVQPLGPEGRTLLQVIDRTVTPMGARLLAGWVAMPLRDAKAINKRLDVVEYFFREPRVAEDITGQLRLVGDLHRLTGKLATRRINPRELLQVAASLQAVGPIRARLVASGQEVLAQMGSAMDACDAFAARITRQIAPDAPAKTGTAAPVIAAGVSDELDGLRDIAVNGRQYLQRLQQAEAERTGISSLKIGFNNVFGYYLEVTNTHRDKVPAEWIRKQTLTNAERYITPELKDYEDKILGAQERIRSIEQSLYDDLVGSAASYLDTMQLDAHMLANLDCLLSFCTVAAENNYNRPVVDDSLVLDLVNARHPVIEKQLPPGQPYIANTVSLDPERSQIMMITGPNMSGKSALLRQTALNVIMAQIGCYVAADSAHIGVVDKIFTRVGASDNISLGESTFMVEMNEAASIVNNLSQRSLVLFDELGRGTSTYDGISIAWAIVEYIHGHKGRPKTLFATHYHELNEMQRTFGRIVNKHVSVKEIDGRIVFLRKLEDGGSEHSFGIHVARLAGLPETVLARANRVLQQLEEQNAADTRASVKNITQAPSAPEGMQMSFFQLDDPVLEQVRDEILDLDLDSLTPLQALNKLSDIRTILTGK